MRSVISSAKLPIRVSVKSTNMVGASRCGSNTMGCKVGSVGCCGSCNSAIRRSTPVLKRIVITIFRGAELPILVEHNHNGGAHMDQHVRFGIVVDIAKFQRDGGCCHALIKCWSLIDPGSSGVASLDLDN